MGTRFYSETGRCTCGYESREQWENEAHEMFRRERVAKIAHQLWIAEGKPANSAERHWLKAEEIYKRNFGK